MFLWQVVNEHCFSFEISDIVDLQKQNILEDFTDVKNLSQELVLASKPNITVLNFK